MIGLHRKFQRNVQDYGIPVALRKTIKYLFRFIYDSRVYRIYLINLSGFTPRIQQHSNYQYKFIDENDAACIRQIEHMEEWLEGTVSKKLRNGGLCLVAMDKENLAGFNIVAFGTVYMTLVKKYKVFRAGEAWSEQITVNNRYRGKGLGSELRFRMFAELKARGTRKFYGGTLSNNEANLKLTRKVGFKEIADIEYVSILNFRRRRTRRVT